MSHTYSTRARLNTVDDLDASSSVGPNSSLDVLIPIYSDLPTNIPFLLSAATVKRIWFVWCLRFHLETIAITFLWVVRDTTEWRTTNRCTIPLKWRWWCTILCGVRERCWGSATGHIQGVWGCWGLHSPANKGPDSWGIISDIKLVQSQAFAWQLLDNSPTARRLRKPKTSTR